MQSYKKMVDYTKNELILYSKLIGFTKNIKKSPFLQMEKGVWGMRSKKAFHF
jgi:hypothetical protein